MNVGAYANNAGGDFPPPLNVKAFNKNKDKRGYVSGKVLAVREINTPGGKKKKDGTKSKPFHGIALDVKVNGTKYGFLTSFDRFDVGAICEQLGSTETDDFIGETLKFVLSKGKYVNVARLKNKK